MESGRKDAEEQISGCKSHKAKAAEYIIEKVCIGWFIWQRIQVLLQMTVLWRE